MLTGLKRQLKGGERIKGTLQFEKAGKVDVEFTVRGTGGKGGAGHGSHGGPHMKH
jgi:copper(I)-binding protein